MCLLLAASSPGADGIWYQIVGQRSERSLDHRRWQSSVADWPRSGARHRPSIDSIFTKTERSFKVLNMRSSDDRTTSARIRDAAIFEFANNGVAGTSVRTIAAAADVSPGLVIHHFGSKEGLRAACDEHVAALIRDLKAGAMASGAGFDVVASFRSIGDVPASKYLARTLVDGSPHVSELVDELTRDAVEYIETGVKTGMLKPSDYPKERAAILMIWSLGALVLHEHLERLIGVDITADFGANPKAASAYMAPILDIYSNGLITETTVKLMSEAFVDASQKPPQEKDTP